MLRNNYFGETKTHYKLYKCGKNWAVMGISVFLLGLGMLVTSRPVSADAAATSTSSSAVRTETTSATKADSASQHVTSISTDASKNQHTSSNVILTNDNKIVSASINQNASTIVVNKAVSATSQENSSVQNASTTSDKEALTHVTRDTFLAYFSLDGSATYDQNTGTVTITPDDYNKIGSFFLKSKIDMNTSFTLTGEVNLGSDSNGADGIGNTRASVLNATIFLASCADRLIDNNRASVLIN